jgi:archaellum biogenesis ATPase FlaH
MISLQFLLVLTYLPCISSLLSGQPYVVSRKVSHTRFHPLSMVSSQTNSGLLEGIPDIASAQYFSEKMSIPKAAALAQNCSLLYDIVRAHCHDSDKCLEAIEHKMNDFMEKNEVFNRKDFKNALDEVTNEKGTFSCVLGGKSTGKSLVLRDLCRGEIENKKKKFIYVNLRKGYSSITEGFVEVIQNSNNPGWRKVLEAFLTKGIQSKVKISDKFEVDFSSFLDGAKTAKGPVSILASLLDEMITESPADIITLIVDEASLALTISDKASEEKIEQVKAALSLFTRLTKQEKKVSFCSTVCLVSCLHSNRIFFHRSTLFSSQLKTTFHIVSLIQGSAST